MKSIVNLDTDRRNDGSTLVKPRWNVSPSFCNIASVRVLSLTLPISFYNISSRNNIVYFSVGATPYVATLTEGNYDASTMAVELKARMDAASGSVFTVVPSTATGKFTVSVAAGTFRFTFGTNTSSSAGPSLGFTLDGTLAASQVGDSVMQLNYPARVYLTIETLSINSYVSGIQNCIMAIPVTGEFGDTITYFDQSQYYNHWYVTPKSSINNLGVIGLNLVDAANNAVEMNGVPWNVTLEIEYTPN